MTAAAPPAPPVTRAAMVNRWETLTFLHWRYPPEVVQRLLPAGLEVETFDGSAWVALVPFRMRVTLPRAPEVPWLSRFPETNVRTYARDGDGRPAVWFLSLDAARLPAVLAARAAYGLPYHWALMRVSRHGHKVGYGSRRRWSAPRGARSVVVVEIGDPFAPEELSELDHLLTARWALVSEARGGLRRVAAAHDPWPLHHARVLHLRDELVEAGGLPSPSGAPLVHYAPAVEVRLGWPAAISGR